MTPTPVALLAHQGGWDELLFVITPLVIFAGLLVLARRRVGQMEARTDAEASDRESSDGA